MRNDNFAIIENSFEQKLKKQNRWIKFIALGWATTLLLGAVYVAQQSVNASDSTLELRRLSIVDENGVPRLVLGSPNPDPQIRGKLYKRRSPSTGIQFNDKNGDEIGGIGSLDDGTKNLCFDAGNHERICMYFLPDGRTGFLVKDGNGNERASLGLTTKEGHSDLALSDSSGKLRIRLRVEQDGTPLIETFDEKGKAILNKKE